MGKENRPILTVRPGIFNNFCALGKALSKSVWENFEASGGNFWGQSEQAKNAWTPTKFTEFLRKHL